MSIASAAAHSENGMFEHAPPSGLQRRLGLVKPGQLRVGYRMLLVVLIGWLPLVVLTVAQSITLRIDGIHSLLWEVGAHARYLIAAPLLILAEAECGSRLNAIARHFIESGLVPDRERTHFEAAFASTRRLLNSTAAEIAVVALAYLIVAGSAWSHPIEQIPVWHKSGGTAPVYSPAGWWHLLVSLPLLLILFLGWMWRLVLWVRLLWLISRLDLRLLASHPDHAAGLGFVGHSVGAFSIVALALSTIIAGRSAHIALLGDSLLAVNLFFNIGLLTTIVAMFTVPLLVFTPVLLKTWQRGTLKYGALADRVGIAFESKWLGADKRDEPSALEKPDFSATTDLYSIVANVHAMRLVPVGLKDLIALAAAVLIPFVPVVLLAVPVNTLLQSLKKLLF